MTITTELRDTGKAIHILREMNYFAPAFAPSNVFEFDDKDLYEEAMTRLYRESISFTAYEYELSSNQKRFVEDAREEGFDVDFEYSGRGMFGEWCPAINVRNLTDFNSRARVKTDQMGKGYVIYAPN